MHQKTAQDIDDILKMLLQYAKSSVVNFQDAQNRNILHFVSISYTIYGNMSSYRSFLKMALLPNVGSSTALQNKIQTMVDKKLVNDKDIYGNTPLHAVAMNDDSQAAQT